MINSEAIRKGVQNKKTRRRINRKGRKGQQSNAINCWNHLAGTTIDPYLKQTYQSPASLYLRQHFSVPPSLPPTIPSDRNDTSQLPCPSRNAPFLEGNGKPPTRCVGTRLQPNLGATYLTYTLLRWPIPPLAL